MHELGQALWQLVVTLGDAVWMVLVALYDLAVTAGLTGPGLILAAWIAWWLWAANWRHLWPTLRQGGWAPVVLLTFVAALVWSRLQPGTYDLWGLVLPNLVWQLLGVSLIVALALICGWLQGVFAWYPPEVSFDPPVHGHGHHDHHGHDHHHEDHHATSHAPHQESHGHH